MKVSTKGRYGLRVMLELALYYGKGPAIMAEIEKTQGISRKYMHSILTTLKSAGLVRAIRGAGGGFVLAKEPKEINVHEIVEALEGPFDFTECVGSESFCDKSQECVTRDVWNDVGRAVKEVLTKTKLDELVRRHEEKSTKPDMFYI